MIMWIRNIHLTIYRQRHDIVFTSHKSNQHIKEFEQNCI